MPAETNHKIGEEGVQLVRQFLESTTYVELPHSVYENEGQCTLELLNGKIKRYDLVGFFLTGKKAPLAVESKKYTTVGDQPAAYPEFLAHAYSVTARRLKLGVDDGREFMWVTWHPFSQTKWTQLRSPDEVRAALDVHQEVLGENPVVEEVVRTVAARIWLVVLHDRMSELLLTRAELYKVSGLLDRKGSA